ncbi:hypothetical protein HPB48_009419 [Haemaphysalis longicornis]|uniref:Uncharacterized protein n=1 Tax=Haemaphysalis longicornis TaxID=44386 RepID=A0A9J6FRX2_HAELO|nr:hypothetical protein HPB48_009419 [Haemaphysalis longicornis]
MHGKRLFKKYSWTVPTDVGLLLLCPNPYVVNRRLNLPHHRSLILMVSNKGRSRVTTVLGIFVSLLVLGLVLHHFNSSLVRQHFPKQLCRHASGKKDTEVVVAVKTSPDNYATREAIRNSVASLAVRAVLPWQVVFYMGFSEDAET